MKVLEVIALFLQCVSFQFQYFSNFIGWLAGAGDFPHLSGAGVKMGRFGGYVVDGSTALFLAFLAEAAVAACIVVFFQASRTKQTSKSVIDS